MLPDPIPDMDCGTRLLGVYNPTFLVLYYKTLLHYLSELFIPSDVPCHPFVPFKVNSVTVNGSDFLLCLNILLLHWKL